MAPLRSGHLAFAGVALQLAFAVYAWVSDPPLEPLDVVTHVLAVAVLAGVGLLGIVPALLLLHPTSQRAGRWTALGLGVLLVLLLFWAVEGIVLLAAGRAAWKERPDARDAKA